MDQIMEEARLCQEKLEELKMAAVQVAITLIIIIITNIITILATQMMTRMMVTKPNPIKQQHISISQVQQVFVFCSHNKYFVDLYFVGPTSGWHPPPARTLPTSGALPCKTTRPAQGERRPPTTSEVWFSTHPLFAKIPNPKYFGKLHNGGIF